MNDRTVYSRESSATGWFIGIIVALAILAIGYVAMTSNPAAEPEAVEQTETQ